MSRVVVHMEKKREMPEMGVDKANTDKIGKRMLIENMADWKQKRTRNPISGISQLPLNVWPISGSILSKAKAF